MIHHRAMTSSAHEYRPAARAPLTPPPALSEWEKPALFLDFDGTLVAIADHPQGIAVNPALPGILARLNAALAGRLAIVSGRAIADVDRHLNAPGIAIAGSHGGELRMGGSTTIEPLADPVPPIIEHSLRELAARHGGLLVETKPFSVAIHYRTRPEAETDVLEHAARLAASSGLCLKPGKMVAELVMPGVDKGRAVGTFMQMPAFNGSRPMFLGDDITDEDAFRSVLDHEGGGVLVGPERDTAALWRLPTVSDVHHWLEAAL